MEPIRITPYTIILFAAVLGFLLGLIPLFLGIRRNKTKLGVIGLICSAIGGAISGIFLIIPVIAIFIYLILKNPASTQTVEGNIVNENPIDVKIDNSETR